MEIICMTRPWITLKFTNCFHDLCSEERIEKEVSYRLCCRQHLKPLKLFSLYQTWCYTFHFITSGSMEQPVTNIP